ncbi:energy transducer TonB [Bacteroides sp. 224]|uniref:energy transducer TonB n=1 Tax=Bacteroides sp. 224 TaxID=2302936 RepID=UPI0013D103DC|nr:energy transducer TonB [Bacteroides sp. 224]NDV65257.1 energy transducer TonB [Bacteroides sp. 224]
MKNRLKEPLRKLTLLFFLFTISSVIPNNVNAQTKDSELMNDSTVYDIIKLVPSFPGGQMEMISFINKSIVYPEAAKEKGDQGMVLIQFIVEKDGTITNPTVFQSISPELDAEAIRIVNTMPHWVSGKLNEKSVRTKYTLPISFVINESKTVQILDKDIFPAKGEEVLEIVEIMPEFPGGASALQRFLAENVNYPTEALRLGVSGRVIVSFVIDTNGKAVDPSIIRSVHPFLDAEAKRVIKKMPLWKPGIQKGKKVKVRYTVPLNFKLPARKNPYKMDDPFSTF